MKLKLAENKKNKTKFNILRVASMATCIQPENLDVYLFDGTKMNPMFLNMNTKICSDEALFLFLKQNFPSYSISPTNKLLINDTDALKFVNNTESTLNDLSQSLNISKDEAFLKITDHIKNRDILIRPTGVSGVIHRVQITSAAAGSALHTTLVTASSHISGLTGVSLVSASPILLLTVPTTGAMFFAAGERLFANTSIGVACGMTRDVLLIPMAFTQTILNNLILKPVLTPFNIDAPLNLTSYLKFGAGIKAADSLPGRKLLSKGAKALMKLLEKV